MIYTIDTENLDSYVASSIQAATSTNQLIALTPLNFVPKVKSHMST